MGFGSADMRPHNMTYTASARHVVGRLVRLQRRQRTGSDHLTLSAFCVTHFSAAAGVGLGPVEWITRGKPSVLGAASGAVAGLVCITPAAGFVNPMPALVMGCGRRGLLLACSRSRTSFATTIRWTRLASTASVARWARC